MTNDSDPKRGFLRRLWSWLWRPSARWSLGTILAVGGIAGIIFWGGFNTFMEYTNTEEFCVSCHEMRDNVGVEWKQSDRRAHV